MHAETREDDVPVSSELDKDSRVAVCRIKKLLFRRLRVGIQDGRYFSGKLYCVDKQGNLLLSEAVEYRSRSPSGEPIPVPLGSARIDDPNIESRYLGLILIPVTCRQSCDVEIHEEETQSLGLHLKST
jgi:small nuclear ribonucleoprotein (snRNP)-like protein